MKNKSIASLAVVVLHAASITEGSDTPTAFASFSSDCRRGCLPVEWIPANYFSRRRQSHSNTPLHPARSQNIATQRRPLGNARPSATASIFHSHLEDSEGEPEFFTQHTPKPPKKRKSKRVDLSFIRPGDLNDVDDTERNIVFGNNEVTKQPGKDRLARAAASLMAQREKRETVKKPSYSSSTQRAIAKNNLRRASEPMQNNINNFDDEGYVENNMSGDLVGLTKKIDQKILSANWSRSGQKRRVNDKSPGIEGHVQHATDSMQSLLGYNHFEGDWSDRNSTTYHVAIVFGKPLIRDQVTTEYATRIRTLAKILKEEPQFRPSLICFTGGISPGNYISDASAGYMYFRHLCAAQSIPIDDVQTKMWLDTESFNEREAMERIASELWRNHVKQWLSERTPMERLNRHYGVEWTVLERKIDVHFTLVSTEYHLCNLNDVHHRSPGKSFLQPLTSLRGLVESGRLSNDEYDVVDSGHFSDSRGRAPALTDQSTFGGIQNSVDTSWSFQYGTYPFLHGNDESVVFLGQCFLLGEELTPLLVNMKGVVEQTEFFQRDNYLLLSSIRRSLVSLVEALYTEKGQSIRAGVIKHFESKGCNRFTGEDVKIIVVLESALLNLGRCIDLVKPAGLLVSSVPASTWSRALDALEKSMNNIISVCDPDQPLEPFGWGKLSDDDDNMMP